MLMLSRKAFATNSLKSTFVWDVWFHSQIVYSTIEHLSNINEITYCPPPLPYLHIFRPSDSPERRKEGMARKEGLSFTCFQVWSFLCFSLSCRIIIKSLDRVRPSLLFSLCFLVQVSFFQVNQKEIGFVLLFSKVRSTSSMTTD